MARWLRVLCVALLFVAVTLALPGCGGGSSGGGNTGGSSNDWDTAIWDTATWQ